MPKETTVSTRFCSEAPNFFSLAIDSGELR